MDCIVHLGGKGTAVLRPYKGNVVRLHGTTRARLPESRGNRNLGCATRPASEGGPYKGTNSRQRAAAR